MTGRITELLVLHETLLLRCVLHKLVSTAFQGYRPKGLRTKFCTKWKESESLDESYLYRRSEETCYTNLQEI